MPNESNRNNPANTPDDQSSAKTPVTPTTPLQRTLPGGCEHQPYEEKTETQELAREFRIAEKWAIGTNIVLAIVGICALWIYHGQLCALLESNAINRDALQSVQRAFVQWVGYGANPLIRRLPSGEEERILRFKNTWGNGGNTVATSTAYYFSVNALSSEPTNKEFRGEVKSPDFPTNVIGPKGTLDSGSVDKAESELYGGPITHTIQFKQMTFFWGWIVYRDAFAGTKPHLTEVCHQLTGVNFPPASTKSKKDFVSLDQPSFTFSACREHNCVDNYCKDYKDIIATTPQ